MNYLPVNLKFLRREHGLTQQDLASKLGLKRSHIGAYEEGRASPKIAMLQQMAATFELSLDQLISTDLSVRNSAKGTQDTSLRILSVVVDSANEEMISLVPARASAGYLNGYADPEYMEQLPAFNMPVPELSRGKTYRVFQLKGDSMLPVQDGSYVFCEFVESIADMKDGQTYVLITRDEGLVYKRIYHQEEGRLLLKSDNPDYEAYQVEMNTVLEIWKADGVLSFNLPRANHLEISRLSDILAEMKNEIRRLGNG
ncbi:LexA family transcriptional regulator [Mangrovibacterium marinum]|uniref:Phage repressor protein C with HTH and peptisase S24 domain n=1 Tax=Mangrovibacterium marinum TaxID=1639118 RepID=A0A2T5C3P8_9BACT|nr:LexA family transcriptional regulator [Mangrovibacterium marinum]PTN09359.1 phage repressor protein C with HTH and peptisase S24 domain [Mangrovibacterium marinum]